MNHRDIEALIKGIAPVVRDYIASAMKGFGERISAVESRSLEKGEKGDPGKDGEHGQPGVDGRNGENAPAITREEILVAIKSDGSIIAAAVASYLKDNPPPAGRDGEQGTKGTDGKDGRDGVDGASVVSALINRDGNLVLGLADGKTVDLGLVVGRDGETGIIGAAGRDGFGFDDLEIGHDGERELTLAFVKGDQKKEFKFVVPVVIDRGVWREGQFKPGDGVTWDGSWFVAQKDTDKKPGTPDSGWRLAAKRGRDGASVFDVARKAGFKGSEAQWLSSLKGEKGDEGRPGRDLTQMTLNGEKY